MSDFLQALAICGVGLLVLLLILLFLALLVNGMTSWIKTKDEDDETEEGEEEDNHLISEDQGMAEKVAALGVAFALAELEMSPASGVSEKGEFLPWREYHRARRLNQAIRMRRN